MSNTLENVANKIDKEFNTLKEEDTFKFACNMCGECCFGRADILLSPYDCYNLSKELNKSTEAIINNFCVTFLGQDSKLPIVMLKFRKIKNSSVCPLLIKSSTNDEQLICAVHKNKPSSCAMYPLGRVIRGNLDSDEEIKVEYFDQHVKCCDLPQNEITLKAWKESFNLEESEKYFLMFSKTMIKLTKLIDLKKLCEHKVITEKTKDMYFNALFNILYIGLENTDIEAELTNRYETAIKITKDIVNMSKMLGMDITSEIH